MEKNEIESCLLIIAGSAGSLGVILELIPKIKPHAHLAILVIIHRKENNDSILQEIISNRTNTPVFEIEDKLQIENGNIYIAPANYHLLIEKDYSFSLDSSEKVQFSRPSIDVTFQSAAEIYHENLACLLLSGANADGAAGLQFVLAKKGKAFIQSPATAEVPYMPQQAIHLNPDAIVLSPEEMPYYINLLYNHQ